MFQISFTCRVCGKTETCTPWNPMVLYEVCARPHDEIAIPTAQA